MSNYHVLSDCDDDDVFCQCCSCENTTQHRRNIDRRFYGTCYGRNEIFIWWFSGKKTIFFPDVDGGLTIFDTSPQEGCETEKTHMSRLTTVLLYRLGLGTISEGIQNLEIFWGLALVFVDQQNLSKLRSFSLNTRLADRWMRHPKETTFVLKGQSVL